MQEVLLAAEVLVIGVLDPTGAEHLVRQIVRVLQDSEAGHQPGRQRRLAGRVGVNLAEFAPDERPVDQTAKPYEFVPHVDDLVEPCPEEIILPSRLLAWLHRSPRR